LAHKLAAVNLSDMAAVGAKPKWATLALVLPAIETAWLDRFFISLDNIFKRYGVQLIGGDTTQGPLCLSIQIMGLLNKGEVITRGGAALDDDCYVSGTLGDAALALAAIEGLVELSDEHSEICRQALEAPLPQVELGQRLVKVGNACIDISDGLVADVAHIANQSDVSITIDVDAVPLSSAYQAFLDSGGHLDFALNGGDDYQLAFTAPTDNRQTIEQISIELGITLTRIGKVIAKTQQAVMLRQNNSSYALAVNAGYEHFSNN
jgi:thiamine-monophosphate kinase